MDMLARRGFLKACVAGVGCLVGAELFRGQASAEDRIRWGYPKNSFTRGELNVLNGAMAHLVRYLPSDQLIRRTNEIAKVSYVERNYAQAVGLPPTSAWHKACMPYQLAYYVRPALRQHQLKVFLEPIYRRDNRWAVAPLGSMKTLNVTRGTGELSGKFHVYVNRYWFGQQGGANSKTWAGVLAHELMHNLGHTHGDNEYGLHLQINAIATALIELATRDGYTRDAGETDQPSRFCGCC